MNYDLKAFYPNGYGVSIISNEYSYGGRQGLYELAVLVGDRHDFEVCYDTPITDDVLGYLTLDEANSIADEVSKLDPA